MEVVQVGLVTTCFRPSLSSMERRLLNKGCFDVGERSTLKSPISSRALSFDGGSCSRVDSRLVRTEASEDGGW